MKNFFFALTTLFFLSACSSDTTESTKVSQDEIHQYYTVEFSEENQNTHVFSEFRIGGSTGTTVQLQAPSVVRFNGKDLDRKNFLGTHYVVDIKGPLNAISTWEYIDNNGKAYKNSIELKAVTLLSNISRISRDRGLELNVKADDLSAEDSIEAEIRSSDNTTYVFKTSRTPGAPLSYEVSELSQLKPGPGTLIVKRTRRLSLQSSTPKGGSISAEYTAKPLSIVIE